MLYAFFVTETSIPAHRPGSTSPGARLRLQVGQSPPQSMSSSVRVIFKPETLQYPHPTLTFLWPDHAVVFVIIPASSSRVLVIPQTHVTSVGGLFRVCHPKTQHIRSPGIFDHSHRPVHLYRFSALDSNSTFFLFFFVFHNLFPMLQ